MKKTLNSSKEKNYFLFVVGNFFFWKITLLVVTDIGVIGLKDRPHSNFWHM